MTVGIALNRAQRGFSGRDRTICNLLRPYLIGAYRNIEAATTVRDLLAVLDTVAGEHGQQLVLVDRHANIAHQSREPRPRSTGSSIGRSRIASPTNSPPGSTKPRRDRCRGH